MKRYYCFLALFALLGLCSAQAQITTFPYTQGFESGLGGWTTVDGDNDGENWFSSTGSDEDITPHGGSSYASSWSYDHVYYDSWNPDNYLISPAITVTTGLNLSYYVIRGCHSGYPDQYSLYVSTSATPSDINALTPLVSESPTETQWTKKTFSLENYAGQTVYIVFRHHNSYDMCSIGIDDVTIGEAGMPEVMLPGPQTASIGTPLNIGASVVGAQPLTLTWSSVMASNGDATMYDNGDTLTITYSASGLDTVMLIASNSFGADTATTVVNAYCVAPTAITINSSSTDSVLFSWTGQATDYEYALMVGSAEPGENDIFTTTDNSVLYDTLQGGVTYTFYVRALCGTSHSTWITKQHTPGTYILAANSSDTLRTCGSVIYDDGGPNGSYASNQNTTLYILPTDDTKWVVISGSSYTEGTYDYIRLYDGMGTSGEQLFTDNGISANTSFGPFMCPAGATLTFHSDGSVNYSGFQINVTCIDAPTCLAPTNLTLVRAAEDTLVVSWNAPEGGASDYLVQYRSGSDEWSSLTVTDTVAAIDGLSANTVYEVVVRTLCGSDSSFTISGAYRTACGAITTLPWTESFETFANNTRDTAVTCWNFIWPTGGSSNGYCQVSNSYAVTGSNTLRFSGYASTPMTAILPPFTDDISGLEMSFYLRAENSNAYSGTTNSPGAIRVGYITSIGDSTTFVQTARFECTSGNYGSMALEEVTFAGAPSGARIAIQQVNNGTNYWWWIDDIDVHVAPSCTRPTIAVSDVTTDGATLTLNDASEVGNYRLVVVSGSNSDTIDNVTSPYILTGLASGSAYTVYAYTVCDDGTYTAPSTASFFTACDVVSIFPWSENFDARTTGTFNDPCWTNVHISGGGTSLFSVSAPSQGDNSTNMLRLPDMTSGTMTKLTLPAMQFNDGTLYLFSIDVYRNTTSYPNEGVRVFVNDTNDFEGAAELGFLHRNYTVSDGGIVSAESASGWYTYEFLIPDTIASPVYIILRGESSYGNATYMDNFVVKEAPSCMHPVSVTATGITSTSATLTIADPSNAGSYHLVILSNGDTLVNETVSDLTYTIDTLHPSTSYSVLVSSLCSDGTETSTVSTSFATTCDAVSSIPWLEDFSSEATWICWTTYSFDNNSNSDWVLSDGVATSSYNDVVSANDWLISPALVIPSDADGLSLTWKALGDSYGGNNSHVTVRLSTSGTDTASFSTELFSNDLPDSWNPYSASLDQYAGDTIHVAFIHDSYNDDGPSIDSVQIRYTLAPIVRVSGPVNGYAGSTSTYRVNVIEGSTSSMTYTWTSSLGSTIVADADSADVTFAAAGIDTISVTATNAHGTYTASIVVSVCGTIATLPWTEDFEAQTVGNVPDCWDFLTPGTGYSDNYLQVYSTSSTAHSGSQCLRFNYSRSTGNMIVLPAFSTDISGLELTFWHRPESYTNTSCGTLEVGYITDVTDTTTFVATASFAYNSFTSNDYRLDEALFTNAPTGAMIAFRHSGANNNWYWHVDDLDLHIAPSCSRPTVAVNNITETSADVTLSDADNVNHYRLYLSDGTTTDSVDVTGTTYTYTTLTSSTAYTLEARTICTDGTITSPSSTSFRTPCGAITTLPWSENFDGWSEKSECWSFLSGNYNGGNGPATASTSSWSLNSTYGSYISINGKALTMNLYNNLRYWTVTPIISLNSNNITLSVDVAVSAWSSATPSFDDNDTLAFAISTDGGVTFTNLHVLDGTALNALSTSYTTVTVPVSGYNGQQVRFAVFGGSISGTNPYDNRVAIDNFSVTSDGTSPESYTVSATSANATMGTATVSPNGTVAAGTSVTATATANEGYQFVNWTVSGNVVSNANPYTFTVTANTALVANFEALPEPDCETPTNVTVSDVTLTSATIAWTAGEGQNNWDVHVTGIGYDQTFTTSTNPYTVTGLNADVVYTVTVRANCSATAFSEWSAPVTFTTFSCQSVSGVNVSNVTTNSAQVSWTAVQGVNGYEVEYGASGFNQGAGTTVQASTNNATLTGLTANMAYDVYVRSVCGEGVFSAWSNVTSFTTDEQGEGIDDVNSAAIALYPNPATTTVTISGIEGQAMVKIVDMNGRVSGEWKVENGEITLDLTGYAQGAYFVRITGEQQNAIRKLIVK